MPNLIVQASFPRSASPRAVLHCTGCSANRHCLSLCASPPPSDYRLTSSRRAPALVPNLIVQASFPRSASPRAVLHCTGCSANRHCLSLCASPPPSDYRLTSSRRAPALVPSRARFHSLPPSVSRMPFSTAQVALRIDSCLSLHCLAPPRRVSALMPMIAQASFPRFTSPRAVQYCTSIALLHDSQSLPVCRLP